MKKIKWKVLLFSVLAVLFTALAGSFFTSQGVDTEWYQSIRPEITPPNFVFPIVWNLIFLMIAASLYLAWVKASQEQKTKITLVFGLNFFLNILWSAFYFGLMNPAAAFLELIFLWASILLMIFTVHKINKASAYLLIPYFLWVSFAGILNYLSI